MAVFHGKKPIWLKLCAGKLAKKALQPTLRPATRDDYAFYRNLHHAALRPYIEAIWGWDPAIQDGFVDKALDNYEHKATALRIVEIKAHPVGILETQGSEHRVFISNLWISETWRSKGLGSAIIRNLAERARQNGKHLELTVLTSNNAARRLYERLGFVILGPQDHHYLMRLEER